MKTQPAPELEKLSVFLGDWTTQGTIHPGPWGEGGKFSWIESTRWMAGHFFLIGHWDYTMPDDMGGPGEELFIIGYDPHRRLYTFDAFSSHGLHQISMGQVHGNAWTWDSQATQDGKPVKQKMTMQFDSETTYALKLELSQDGETWQTFMEGQATKKL